MSYFPVNLIKRKKENIQIINFGTKKGYTTADSRKIFEIMREY